jgi:hypothetical protein
MHDRMLGRAAFLGIVGAGLAGLFLGRDAMRLAGRVVPDPVEAIVPTSGWRIYTNGVERRRRPVGGHPVPQPPRAGGSPARCARAAVRLGRGAL